MQTRRLLYCIGLAFSRPKLQMNSVRRSPSTSLTRVRLQTFTPPLSTLPGSSNRKQRRAKERSRRRPGASLALYAAALVFDLCHKRRRPNELLLPTMWALAAVLDGVIVALVMSVVGLWIITQLRLWQSRRSRRRRNATSAVVLTTCRAQWPEQHAA